MVVWRLPCESKSSPAFKLKHPSLERGWGVFYGGNMLIKTLYAHVHLDVFIQK